jgi:acetoin utilization deacetylase AcuC-like enzyme
LNKLNIIYHPDYDIPVPPKHRFVGTKFSDLFFYLQSQTYFSKCKVTQPQKATKEKLLRAHSLNYINKIYEENLSDNELRKINLPWSRQLQHRSFLAIEGTYQAAKLALNYGIACHVGGGTHHAHHEYGFGFCIFNDLAYTALNLIEEGYTKSVLIIDADVHQGDGTIDICQNHPLIYTCSIHSESNFPFKKKQGWLDISIPAGSNDDYYLSQISQTLKEIDSRISPDIVLYDAGIDIFKEDGLGNLNISQKGIIQRDQIILENFKNKQIPIATVIGGGYSIDPHELAARHSIIFEVALEMI